MFIAEILNGPREGWLLPFASELVLAPLQAVMNPPAGSLLILDSDPEVLRRVSFEPEDGAWRIHNQQALSCDDEFLEPGTWARSGNCFQLSQTVLSLRKLQVEEAARLAAFRKALSERLPALPSFLAALDARACSYFPASRYRGVVHWLASLIEHEQGSPGGHAVSLLLQETAAWRVNRTWTGWSMTPGLHTLLTDLLANHPPDLPEPEWTRILLTRLTQATQANPASALALDMAQSLHQAVLELIDDIRIHITQEVPEDHE
ncbi:MAG: hypothetical protein U1D69_04365 [Polynucleobacter sp.]|nr:hypothetical protein [Polynucleobacter sp.]